MWLNSNWTTKLQIENIPNAHILLRSIKCFMTKRRGNDIFNNTTFPASFFQQLNMKILLSSIRPLLSRCIFGWTRLFYSKEKEEYNASDSFPQTKVRTNVYPAKWYMNFLDEICWRFCSYERSFLPLNKTKLLRSNWVKFVSHFSSPQWTQRERDLSLFVLSAGTLASCVILCCSANLSNLHLSNFKWMYMKAFERRYQTKSINSICGLFSSR